MKNKRAIEACRRQLRKLDKEIFQLNIAIGKSGKQRSKERPFTELTTKLEQLYTKRNAAKLLLISLANGLPIGRRLEEICTNIVSMIMFHSTVG